jgi:ABC-type phosphate transport system substrate-binding protein
MRAILRTCMILVTLAALSGPLFASAGTPVTYVVIVNPRNPSRVLSRKFVSEAFLKKTTRWSDGEVIRPVDLAEGTPARGTFTKDMLQRSVAAVKIYWQQIIFSGRDLPPPELSADQDVVRFVMKHGGAIGYVSAAAPVGDAVVVKVQ